MSEGFVHAQIANKTALIICSVSIPVAIISPIFAGVAVGSLIALFVEPDLDHQWRTQSEQRVRRFNPLIGLLWSAYWTPYDWAHPHRGRSHTWPIGTLERFVYALWLPLLASILWGDWIAWFCWWLLVFVGLSLQDCLHLYMDGVL